MWSASTARTRRSPASQTFAVTEQLINDILAAGGTLHVPHHNPYRPDSID